MTPIEAKQFKKWLDEHGAVMMAHVQEGAFIVIIRSMGSPVLGVGHSPDDFEEAIRHAQHYYDLGVLEAGRITQGPVGEA